MKTNPALRERLGQHSAIKIKSNAMLKRIYLPGEIYFITTNAYNRCQIFKEGWVCRLFINVLIECRKRYKFKLYGYVIIPDHVHLLIMPNDKMNISDVMHRIKGNFAYQYIMVRKKESRNRGRNHKRNHKGSATRWDETRDKTRWDENINLNRTRVTDPLGVGGDRIRFNPIWQKSFYDHIIRNDLDFDEKLDYIHKNPINHNLTDNLDNYLWSSYQNYYLNNNSLIEIDHIEL